jgi:hypothetical protein
MLALLTASDDSAAANAGLVSAAAATDDAKMAATAAGCALMASAVASQEALPALPDASGVTRKSMITTPGVGVGVLLVTTGCSTRRASAAEMPVMEICDGGRESAAASALISACSTAGRRSAAAVTPDAVKTTSTAG